MVRVATAIIARSSYPSDTTHPNPVCMDCNSWVEGAFFLFLFFCWLSQPILPPQCALHAVNGERRYASAASWVLAIAAKPELRSLNSLLIGHWCSSASSGGPLGCSGFVPSMKHRVTLSAEYISWWGQSHFPNDWQDLQTGGG